LEKKLVIFIVTNKYVLASLVCMCQVLGLLAYSKSELTSEILNSFRHFGRTPWTCYWPIWRPLPYTGQIITKNSRCASMREVDFEPTIPPFEVSKTISTLDSAATGNGLVYMNAKSYFKSTRRCNLHLCSTWKVQWISRV